MSGCGLAAAAAAEIVCFCQVDEFCTNINHALDSSGWGLCEDMATSSCACGPTEQSIKWQQKQQQKVEKKWRIRNRRAIKVEKVRA